jgi:hypothetical protein
VRCCERGFSDCSMSQSRANSFRQQSRQPRTSALFGIVILRFRQVEPNLESQRPVSPAIHIWTFFVDACSFLLTTNMFSQVIISFIMEILVTPSTPSDSYSLMPQRSCLLQHIALVGNTGILPNLMDCSVTYRPQLNSN